MTEKEWKIIGEEFISYTGGYAILITDGSCQFHLWETRKDAQKVCDKLNELAEEKEYYQIKSGKCEEELLQLRRDNEQLKKDRFICLDCEHSGYVEIGCLCEKKDHWTEYKTDCKDYEELE